jgi:hypothetical protein
MNVGKLRVTIVTEFDVDDLEDYEAESIEQAAQNAAKWIEEGHNSVFDYVDNETSVIKIEVVKE